MFSKIVKGKDLAALESEVAVLREEVASLKGIVEEFKAQFE